MFPIAKTLASIFRARLLFLMIACALVGLLLVIAGVSGLTFFSAQMITIDIPYLGALINWLMGGIFTVVGWFMLPVLIVFIAGMFQEITIHRVEKVDYPETVKHQAPRFWPDLMHDVRFTLWALFLNLLILPFYLIGIGAVLSVLLNSYLLGREFFESAASYHMAKSEAKKLGRRHSGAVYMGGFVITALTLIPLINLFVPIIALVWMVHLYHSFGLQTPSQAFMNQSLDSEQNA
ncbi:MAG: EI24 domain-containing protein [Proteobacteria bacterium]|nr:EI24 domain-containing protein [Pseudomonadota bacterium]